MLIFDPKERVFSVGLTNRAHEDCLKRFVEILNEISTVKTYGYFTIDSYDDVT